MKRNSVSDSHRRRAGFTLIEITIVIAVLVIIAVISIPLMIRNRMQANESSAIGSMRTIHNAQQQFSNQGYVDVNDDGIADYGTMMELTFPPGGSDVGYIDQSLGSGFKSGYAFIVEVFPGDGVFDPAYSARAFPVEHGRSGNRNFYVDQTGVVRFTKGEDGVITLGPDSAPIN